MYNPAVSQSPIDLRSLLFLRLATKIEASRMLTTISCFLSLASRPAQAVSIQLLFVLSQIPFVNVKRSTIMKNSSMYNYSYYKVITSQYSASVECFNYRLSLFQNIFTKLLPFTDNSVW